VVNGGIVNLIAASVIEYTRSGVDVSILKLLQFDPKYELASMIDQSSVSYESAKILCGAHVAKNIILAQRSAREKPKSSSPSDSLQNLSRRKFFRSTLLRLPLIFVILCQHDPIHSNWRLG
jgi:hypothetical protein